MERQIVFIRHGEAYNNLSRYNRDIYHTDVFFDARLTDNGIKQCKDVKKRLHKDFDMVYVSPLDRTLETASIIFEDYTGVIDAHELLREYKNCHSSYRKNIDYKKKEFPKINYRLINTNQDILENEIDIKGKRCCLFPYIKKHSSEFMMERVRQFIKLLRGNRYNKICIVSHRGFIHMFCRLFGKHVDLENCGVYKFKVIL